MAHMSVVRQERRLSAGVVAGLGASARAVRRAYRWAAYLLDSDSPPVWETVTPMAVVAALAAFAGWVLLWAGLSYLIGIELVVG